MDARCIFLLIFSLMCLPMAHSMKKGGSTRGGRKFDIYQKAFPEPFSPPQMLFVSSPMERKISYIQVENFKAKGDVVLPLIDAGLQAPTGLAWDAGRHALYICDSGQKKIFRVEVVAYQCPELCKGVPYQLKTTGSRLTVVEGVVSQWATVDVKGNLYYSDQATKSVSKLPRRAIDDIVDGRVTAKQLLVTTEAEAEGMESAKESFEDDILGTVGLKAKAPAPPPPAIYQLYTNGASPNVGTPAGLDVRGDWLFWTNQVGGRRAGTLAVGKTVPRAKRFEEGQEGPSFMSHKINNISGHAYGLALTSNKALYTDVTHTIWGSSRGSGQTVAMSNALVQARAVVWDGQETVFIADEGANAIESMPCSELRQGQPLSMVVTIHNPFGLALISPSDPIWDPFLPLSLFSDSSASTQALTALPAMIAFFMLRW